MCVEKKDACICAHKRIFSMTNFLNVLRRSFSGSEYDHRLFSNNTLTQSIKAFNSYYRDINDNTVKVAHRKE